MGVSLAAAFLLLFVGFKDVSAVNLTGCIYHEPWPYVIDAVSQPVGDIFTPGFHEGMYPDNMFCDYTIKAAPGNIIKLTFKEMELEAAAFCHKDKVYVVDGPNDKGEDLGAYCGLEPPPFPILSKQNAMHLSFRSDYMSGRKGFHAHYEAIPLSRVCPSGYALCKNNKCYEPTKEKCNGIDNCGDGTDEEGCNLPLPPTTCGHNRILPLEASSLGLDRIVGGMEARQGSWPWQADMQLWKFFPNSHHCGGTLINPQWVMTAAHCLQGHAYPEHWRVHLGNHHKFEKDQYEQIRYVERIVLYPGHTGEAILKENVDFNHDVALMKLNAPVEITEYVRPACLAPQGYEMPEGTKCIGTGWGITRGSGSDDVLKQAELYVQPENICPGMRLDTMICVKSRNGLQDVCHGDSGGPLACKVGNKWFVTGVTSFGITTNMMSGLCAVGHTGTVFNKVSAKTDWISDMIRRFS